MSDKIKIIGELTKMDEPVEFPCLFVPISVFGKNGWKYQLGKAFVTECKIRGAGHYFKIKKLTNRTR